MSSHSRRGMEREIATALCVFQFYPLTQWADRLPPDLPRVALHQDSAPGLLYSHLLSLLTRAEQLPRGFVEHCILLSHTKSSFIMSSFTLCCGFCRSLIKLIIKKKFDVWIIKNNHTDILCVFSIHLNTCLLQYIMKEGICISRAVFSILFARAARGQTTEALLNPFGELVHEFIYPPLSFSSSPSPSLSSPLANVFPRTWTNSLCV